MPLSQRRTPRPPPLRSGAPRPHSLSALLIKRRLIKTVRRLERLAQAEPGRFEVFLHLGLANVKLGADAEAVASLERAAYLNPQHQPTWAALGAALARTGRPGEAGHAFETALQLQPGDAEGQARTAVPATTIATVPPARVGSRLLALVRRVVRLKQDTAALAALRIELEHLYHALLPADRLAAQRGPVATDAGTRRGAGSGPAAPLRRIRSPGRSRSGA